MPVVLFFLSLTCVVIRKWEKKCCKCYTRAAPSRKLASTFFWIYFFRKYTNEKVVSFRSIFEHCFSKKKKLLSLLYQPYCLDICFAQLVTCVKLNWNVQFINLCIFKVLSVNLLNENGNVREAVYQSLDTVGIWTYDAESKWFM